MMKTSIRIGLMPTKVRRISRQGLLEIGFYCVLFAVATAMRFWDLGAQAMHHDESLHANYGFQNFLAFLGQSEFYRHHPITHGVLLMHAIGASFLLFGDSEVTARVPLALSGSVLVLLPLLLRPWLSRSSVATTALLLAFSPSLLYFSRFARNDLIMVVFALLIFISFWRYSRTRNTRWVVITAIFAALGFTTKETQYITLTFFVIAVFLMKFPELWQYLRRRIKWSDLSPESHWLTFLFITIAPLFSPGLALFQDLFGIVLAAPDGTPGIPTGSPAPTEIRIATPIFVSSLVLSFWLLVLTRRWAFVVGWILFYLIFALIFTNFFTYPVGAASGAWQSLGYWLAQQDVARGGQPWYYFLMLAGVYEFLILGLAALAVVFWGFREFWRAAGISGGLRAKAIYLLSGGDTFVKFLIFWVLASFIAYTVASEKFPWLLANIAMPTAILAGKLAGDGLQLCWHKAVSNRMMGGALLFGALIVLLPLLVLTIRAGWVASYGYRDYPQELLIYTHTSHETHQLAADIEFLAAESGLGYELPVAVGTQMEWPWQWYLRHYKNRRFYVNYSALDSPALDPDYATLQEELSEYPIHIVVDGDAHGFRQSSLGNSHPVERPVVLRWSFPEQKYRCGTGIEYAEDDPVAWWCYGHGGRRLDIWDDVLIALFDPERIRPAWEYWIVRNLDGNPRAEEQFLKFNSRAYFDKSMEALLNNR